MTDLDPQLVQRLKTLKTSFPYFSRSCLKIYDAAGSLVPFEHNETQQRLHEFIEKQKRETGMVRIVIVKGRKQGCSTYVAGRYIHQALFHPVKNVCILSHHASTTGELFNIVDTMYKSLPDPIKEPKIIDNTRQIQFKNQSKYTVYTAGEGEVGRGGTPQLFHGSEAASWENTDAIKTGILQSISDVEGTEIILESTAKGIGNFFHQIATSAAAEEGLYRLFFAPWYWEKKNYVKPPEGFIRTTQEKQWVADYGLSDGQLYWRRLKVMALGETFCKQEFPFTIEEAFQSSGESLISGEDISRARKREFEPEEINFYPLVIGVDAARMGDRTIVSFRRGRALYRVDKYKNMNEMKLSGILAEIINKHGPQAVFIDVACGYGTIDRLTELGFGRIIKGVHFNQSPRKESVYVNKRAEMAGDFRDWLKEDVSIPDDNDISFDCAAIPDFEQDSNSRYQLVSKKKIKEKYGKSPDIFDSIMLTFAEPVKNVAMQNEMHYNSRNTVKQKTQTNEVQEAFNRKGTKYSGTKLPGAKKDSRYW